MGRQFLLLNQEMFLSGFRRGADVCGTGAAAAADDLRASGEPLGCACAEVFRICGSYPAARGGVPALAGVWIDEDGFV